MLTKRWRLNTAGHAYHRASVHDACKFRVYIYLGVHGAVQAEHGHERQPVPSPALVVIGVVGGGDLHQTVRSYEVITEERAKGEGRREVRVGILVSPSLGTDSTQKPACA